MVRLLRRLFCARLGSRFLRFSCFLLRQQLLRLILADSDVQLARIDLRLGRRIRELEGEALLQLRDVFAQLLQRRFDLGLRSLALATREAVLLRQKEAVVVGNPGSESG